MSISSTPLHIVIIGAGIGGLCLAQGLKAAGISVAVYERNASDTWPEGYRIHINPVGSRALHACLPPVLWDAFVATAGKPPAGFGILTERLQELIVVGEEVMSSRNEHDIAAHYPVSRIALRHLLLAGLQDVVYFDKTFERYEHTGDGKVTSYFSDGTSVTGDVLVGADGANSKVRQQYLPQARRVELGAMGVAGKLLLTEQTRAWLPRQLATRMNLLMPSARYCLFNAAFDRTHTSAATLNDVRQRALASGLNTDLLIDDTPDYLLWGLFAHTDEYPANIQDLDEQDLLRIVDQMMQGWHPDVRHIVAESAPRSVGVARFKASTLIDPWESSNVTLLGDAIHNMPPVGGLGGNMALRDAWSLMQALTDVQHNKLPLLPAIQGYEVQMRTHGYAAVRAAVSYTQLLTTNKRWQRFASRTWFRTCNAIPPLKHIFELGWTRPMRD